MRVEDVSRGAAGLAGCADGAAPELRLILVASPLAVRAGLAGVMAALSGRLGEADARQNVELVLAEVLNNIVLHAHGGRADGLVDLRLRPVADGVLCRVLDDGAPMARGGVPDGSFPPAGARGGFGWVLIRALATGISYRRREGRNCLDFRIVTGRAVRAI